MKSAKIFIAFTFLLAFAVCVSAQSNDFPNEIQGFEFFKSGRFNGLKLLVSNRNDVKAIFGEKCDNGCDYDDNWEIGFSYVNNIWNRKTVENGIEKIYRPKPELIGKLAGITFRPKKLILLSEYTVIPQEIKCLNGTSYGKYIYKSRTCVDDNRVIYQVADETLENKQIVKGQITSISYISSEKEDNNIYVLVEK